MDTNSYTTEEMAPSKHTTSGSKIISQLQTLKYTCKTFPSNAMAEENRVSNAMAEEGRVGIREKGKWKGEKVPPSNQRDSF